MPKYASITNPPRKGYQIRIPRENGRKYVASLERKGNVTSLHGKEGIGAALSLGMGFRLLEHIFKCPNIFRNPPLTAGN